MRVAIGATRRLGMECIKFLHEQGVEIIGVDCTLDVDHRESCFDLCMELGIKVLSYKEIVESKPDLFISIKYPKIIKKDLLDICPCINLHTARLPQYRGCNGFYHAIVNNDLIYGTTLMEIDEGIDTGRIIAERFLTIRIRDTSETLAKRVYALSLRMFKEEWQRIADKSYSTYEQQGEPRYYPRSLDREISGSPIDVYNKVRALDFKGYEPPIKDGKIITTKQCWTTEPIKTLLEEERKKRVIK